MLNTHVLSKTEGDLRIWPLRKGFSASHFYLHEITQWNLSLGSGSPTYQFISSSPSLCSTQPLCSSSYHLPRDYSFLCFRPQGCLLFISLDPQSQNIFAFIWTSSETHIFPTHLDLLLQDSGIAHIYLARLWLLILFASSQIQLYSIYRWSLYSIPAN